MFNREPLTARHAGDIIRYHTWPTIRQQTVGAHTWQVYRIFLEVFGLPDPKVGAMIIYHDAGEVSTGDIPFDVKREHPEFRAMAADIDHSAMVSISNGLVAYEDLSNLEHAMIKFADLCEMAEFGMEEMRLGNMTYGRPVVVNIFKALVPLCKEFFAENDAVDHFVANLHKQYKDLVNE